MTILVYLPVACWLLPLVLRVQGSAWLISFSHFSTRQTSDTTPVYFDSFPQAAISQNIPNMQSNVRYMKSYVQGKAEHTIF